MALESPNRSSSRQFLTHCFPAEQVEIIYKTGFYAMTRPFMQRNGIIQTNQVVEPRVMKLGGIAESIEGDLRDFIT